MPEAFSVCQFFVSGHYEYVREGVSPEAAVSAAMHYATSVGAKLGTTSRVIITDSDDCCCWEWTHDQGVTFGASPEHLGKLKRGLSDSPVA